MPRWLEFLLASTIALFTGFFGLIFLFSDVTYGTVERALWYGIHFVAPGLVIGFAFPRAWYMSALVAWGVLFLLPVGLLMSMCASEAPRASVSAVVSERSIQVSPNIAPTDFNLDLRNIGKSVHELALVPNESEVDPQALADTLTAFPAAGLGFPPLDPGERTAASIGGMISGRYLLLCSMPGHASSGEVAELRVGLE